MSAAAAAGAERRFTVGVSLKLYLGVAESVDWAASLARIVSGHPVAAGVDLFAAPSFPALPAVRSALGDSGVRLAAQNVHWGTGAFTGEVGASQLAEVGCTLVEIGHAERRRLFGETDEIVAAKASAADGAGLQPLICVGEPSEVSPAIAAKEVVDQADAAFSAAPPHRITPWMIAYEPHWAIGRAEPAPVAHVAAVIDALAAWGRETGHAPKLLYGGSAGPGLLTELRSRTPHIDGVFLGRFAHDPAAVGQVLDEIGTLQRH